MISALATVRLAPPKGSHGGRFAPGQPSMLAVHCTQSPCVPGRAEQDARYVASKGLSVHYLVDPGDVVSGLDESLIGYGTGVSNPAVIHLEICGYAEWTRAEWIANAGDAIALARPLVADICQRHGFQRRQLTDAEVMAVWRGKRPGGVTSHGQLTRLGIGTTHTDPGPNFPYDLLLASASGESEDTVTPQDIDAIADRVVTKLLDAEIPVVDAAQGTTDAEHSVTYKLGGRAGLLARLIRLTALTQDWVRKGAHPKEDTQ